MAKKEKIKISKNEQEAWEKVYEFLLEISDNDGKMGDGATSLIAAMLKFADDYFLE